MTVKLDWIENGNVTSPQGWQAGATYAGIKTYGPEPRLDLGLLASDRPCAVAGLFTTNAVCGAPVVLCRARVAEGSAQALIANSGCSNVATGERGHADARRMAELAAARLEIPAEQVLVASTGIIGRPLPMEKIEASVPKVTVSPGGGLDFTRAIMTTDKRPKSRALRFSVAGRTYVLAGTAKGAGMVHPDLATTFCFLTTDAPVKPPWLRAALRAAGDVSFNMIDVDMDTSTSDTMLLFANGAAGGETIEAGHPAAEPLQRALETICIELARDLVRDAEGARTMIEVTAVGAASDQEARKAARTVVSSPLVKTMITGRDPNLGRVLAAVGRSGARVDLASTSVWIGEHCAFERGAATDLPYDAIRKAMDREEVKIRVDLGLGSGKAVAWGCDLTEEYIRINADYST